MPGKYEALKTAEMSDCGIKDCAIGRRVDHCGACPDFPCPRIRNFANDGIPHHAAVMENLTAIREMGAEAWLLAQEAASSCRCGKRLSWYATSCCPSLEKT